MTKRKVVKRTKEVIATKLFEDDYEYVLKQIRLTYRKKSDLIAALVREAIKYRREKKEDILDPELKEALTPLSKRLFQKLDDLISKADENKKLVNDLVARNHALEQQNETLLANQKNMEEKVESLRENSTAVLQNVIVLRWINLIFNMILYPHGNTSFKNMKTDDWQGFVGQIYTRSLKIKREELANHNQENFERDFVRQKVNELLKFLENKPSAPSE